MVTEDRRRTGLMLQATLRHNIVLPSLPYHHRRFGFLDNKWEADIAQEMTQKLRVKTPSIQTIIANLSGGNQQKVILAKWLIANSKILILDEPTRGIDVNAKSEFYADERFRGRRRLHHHGILRTARDVGRGGPDHRHAGRRAGSEISAPMQQNSP